MGFFSWNNELSQDIYLSGKWLFWGDIWCQYANVLSERENNDLIHQILTTSPYQEKNMKHPLLLQHEHFLSYGFPTQKCCFIVHLPAGRDRTLFFTLFVVTLTSTHVRVKIYIRDRENLILQISMILVRNFNFQRRVYKVHKL